MSSPPSAPRPPDGGSSARALRWIGAEVPPGHFFEGIHVLRRVTPFLATGVLPFVLLPVLGIPLDSWQVAAAFAVSAAILGTALLLPWERLPDWTQVLPVLAGFVVIALLRDTSAEDAVIFEPLVIIPVAWLALYGTRGQLWAAIGAMVATMALPPLLVGSPYENDQIVRAGLAAVIGGTTGIAVQELVRATRALASEARAILETSQDAFVSVDEGKGRIVEWNLAAERMFGWERSEVLGKTIMDTIVHPAEQDLAVTRLQRLAERGEGPPRNRVQAKAVRRDGSEFPIEMTVSPVRSEAGWTFNAFVHDISERVGSQLALQEAEERFRRAFEDNRVGMALISPEGSSPASTPPSATCWATSLPSCSGAASLRSHTPMTSRTASRRCGRSSRATATASAPRSAACTRAATTSGPPSTSPRSATSRGASST